ncbi:MAG: 50S ribosomal protein L25/general stress protein Ctc [Gammaproteobacteria bacterium]|jgi:large subunit ribosomal protein L25
MQSFELTAEPRTDVGKGASRRLRRSGRVPGILYGSDKDAAMVSFDHDDLLHRLDYEAFFSHILTIKLDGASENVVLKDLQRHPFKRMIYHVDFQRINEKEELTMRVPLHFVNEETCPGVKTGGGVISHIMTDLEIACLPKDLPEYIEVDLGALDLGDAIHLGELKLPGGVEILSLRHGGDPELPVVNVHLPHVEVEEEEVEEAAAEELAAEAPEAEAEGGEQEEQGKDKEE